MVEEQLDAPIITEQKPSIERHLKVDIRYLLGLVLSLAAAGTYLLTVYIGTTFNQLEAIFPMNESVNALSEVFDGTLYLSLSPLTESGEPGKVGIYTFDVQTGVLARYIGDTVTHSLTSSLSPDGNQIAFARVDDEAMTIFYGATDLVELSAIPLPEGIAIARSPVWSPDGTSIVFTGRRDKEGGSLGLNDWDVYRYTLTDKSVTRVSDGTNPMFLPDGSLLVLQEDGLHRITDANDTIVMPMVQGVAAANMKLDVSQDGTKLAWAVPDSSIVVVKDVTSWEPFEAASIEIPTAAFWPTFSPEGDYLAMQAFEWGSDGETVENYRLAIFSLPQQSWHEEVVDLSPYYQESLFITDWR